MFTGLIETVGVVHAAQGDSPRHLTISAQLPLGEVHRGDSISIDGCCLTVVACDLTSVSFEAATETLSRTTLGALRVGDSVNLERSLHADGRLDGHLVLGHVDGIGTVCVREQRGSALYLGVAAAADIIQLTAPRGSIAIAGVSLTVTEVVADTIFVGLIPHTLGSTNLALLAPGSRVNLEADVISRYVARQLSFRHDSSSLTVEYLKDKGFL